MALLVYLFVSSSASLISSRCVPGGLLRRFNVSGRKAAYLNSKFHTYDRRLTVFIFHGNGRVLHLFYSTLDSYHLELLSPLPRLKAQFPTQTFPPIYPPNSMLYQTSLFTSEAYSSFSSYSNAPAAITAFQNTAKPRSSVLSQTLFGSPSSTPDFVRSFRSR